MTASVFIDGQHGTTGLRIRDLLGGRDDIAVLEIDGAKRKDTDARRACLNDADLAILCLPDDAAREAVALVDGDTRIIDCSTAHRVAEGWSYGLPELTASQRDAIAGSSRVSNPGCYPTGVALLLRPLVDAGVLATDAALSVHALSGYSGGGRPLIERWQDASLGLAELKYEAPYALDTSHKHLPEMQRHSGLTREPQFVPAVGPFHSGMRIEVPLHRAVIGGADGVRVWDILAARYADEAFVSVIPISKALAGDEQALDPCRCNGDNRIELRVIPHPAGHVMLVAILDNLGKGAGGAAVQNMNLMLGLPEDAGL